MFLVFNFAKVPTFHCFSFSPSALRFRSLTLEHFDLFFFFFFFVFVYLFFFKLFMDFDIGEEYFGDYKWAKFVYKQHSYGP